MEKCFVIQPFDNDKFDKRFNDIFKPAINNAGFDAYRIDRDDSVTIPIEEIENGIASSSICFAEITTNNPNVWYELGYAYACKKNVILVCSEERTGGFPFDIQHKFIITYKTSSISDYHSLQDKITSKLIALKSKEQKFKKLTSLPLEEKEGLQSHQIAIMLLILENSVSFDETISIYNLRTLMDQAGFNNAATSLGVRSLVSYGLVELKKEIDFHGNEFITCKFTEDGEGWILANQHLINFKKEVRNDLDEFDNLAF